MKILQFLTLILFAGGIVLFSCHKEPSCEGCLEIKKAPISKAGPNQVITLPTDSITLDGSASSDADGTISEWLWTIIPGPASFISNNASAHRMIVKKLAAGIYLFELRVTDNEGLSAKDTMEVIVNSSGNPPNSSCFAHNLNWTSVVNGMMALINPGAIAGTLDCAGYGIESWIPYRYDVWVQYEVSQEWVHLDYVFRDAINSAPQNIFLSSTIYNDPTGNDGPVQFLLYMQSKIQGSILQKK